MATDQTQPEDSGTLKQYLTRFGLNVSDLVEMSGRSRYTLYGWYSKKKDLKMINALIMACLAGRFIADMSVEELFEDPNGV